MMAFKAVVFLLYFPFFLEKQRIYKYNQSFLSIMTKIGQFMI